MVFEFLSGGMKIVTDKETYKLGETVNATITLDLRSPVKARGAMATLRAYYQQRTTHRNIGSSHSNSSTQNVTLFADERVLDKEQEFKGKKDYPVTFTIPNDPNLLSQPGMLGFIGGRTVFWEINAKLDIPMGMDIGATKRLNVIA